MALTRTPPSRWINEGLRALAAGGPDAVRIEALARALGVTKGGFYWHFDHRRALLDEMLDTWERVSIDEVIERVEGEGGDAIARLRRLFALASSSDELLRIDLAVRDWARREQTVADRLRRVDNRRMEYMRSLFGAFCPDEDDVEARCVLALSLFIGNHFMATDHGARSRADVLGLAARRLLAQTFDSINRGSAVRHEGPWRGVDDLELATLNWVWWFNHVRIHGEIGYVTPVEFENAYHRQINPQQHPLLGEPSLH